MAEIKNRLWFVKFSDKTDSELKERLVSRFLLLLRLQRNKPKVVNFVVREVDPEDYYVRFQKMESCLFINYLKEKNFLTVAICGGTKILVYKFYTIFAVCCDLGVVPPPGIALSQA